MRRILVLAALCGPVEWLTAQSAPLVAPGNRVRVRTLTASGVQAEKFEGIVEHVSGDSITMLPKLGGHRRLYLPSPNTQLYVLTGHRSSLLRGTALGAVMGILAGGVWGMTRQSECTGNKYLCVNRKPLAFKEGILIGAAGAALGLAFGAVDRREVWTRAWMLSTEAPDNVTGRGGINLGFSFAF